MHSPSETLELDDRVIAFRTSRSVGTNVQTQSNLGLSDASVPPPADRVSATVAGSTRNPQFNYYRAASNIAQLVLPLVATIVGAGPPMHAAINGLLAILRIVDSNQRDMEDLADLISRLHRLSTHIRNAPTAVDPGEQSSRDSLISMLQKTTSELENLRKDGITSTSSISQDIIGCSKKINDYLLDYLTLSQVEIAHDVRAIFTTAQSMQLPKTSTNRGVTPADATGREHLLIMDSQPPLLPPLEPLPPLEWPWDEKEPTSQGQILYYDEGGVRQHPESRVSSEEGGRNPKNMQTPRGTLTMERVSE